MLQTLGSADALVKEFRVAMEPESPCCLTIECVIRHIPRHQTEVRNASNGTPTIHLPYVAVLHNARITRFARKIRNATKKLCYKQL